MSVTIQLPVDDSGANIQGVDNVVVQSLQKEGDLLKITVSFTIKDGSKIPRDAG